MQTLNPRTIETKIPLQTKMLFLFLFAESRGAANRIRIMSALRKKPRNRNQLSKELGMDYKHIQYHLKVLEKNNLVTQISDKRSSLFFLSTLYEANEAVFDEIIIKLKKRRSNQV